MINRPTNIILGSIKENNKEDSYCHYSGLPSPRAYERKEIIKDMEEKITASTQLNRLKDDIQNEFDKINWMIDKYTHAQDDQIKFRDELIELLYSQVIDLTMMSKIELGDDVIEEVNRLKGLINK